MPVSVCEPTLKHCHVALLLKGYVKSLCTKSKENKQQINKTKQNKTRKQTSLSNERFCHTISCTKCFKIYIIII